MFKINFSKDVIGILLIACISLVLFTAYNVFFVFPSFSNLFAENMENEAADIATHFNSSFFMMNKNFEQEAITGHVRKEVGLLKKDFGLWKLRIISPEGRVVFSTDPSETGRQMKKGIHKVFEDDMAKGLAFKHFVTRNGRTYCGSLAPVDLAIAYVPVMQNGRFAGACGVYADVTALKKKTEGLFLASFLLLAVLVAGLLSAVIIISIKANRIAGARRKAEEALQRSEYLLRSIIETEPECVKLTTGDGTLLMMNPAGLKMIQACSLNEVKGRPIGELVTPEHRGAFDELTRRVLAGGTGSLEFEITGLKGRSLWLETNAVPFFNEKGDIAGMLGISRDITAKKLSTEALESSLREKETLLRELYHRTKNNMQVISSLISLQSSSVSDERILQMFDDTKNRIRAMALVHEKLYQSRDLSSVNMKEYLTELANVLLESHMQRDGKVALKIDADDIPLPIDVITPCGLIMNELISNSLKYAFNEGSGEIRISFHQTGDGQMELIYGDNGPGLKSADLKNMKTLGLKLVNSLVTKQLGGKIEIVPGNGTEFRIRFKI
ncbi:MAG: PAS domain S-box protein [Nitrospiraceae bacterium]|nr:PAS domain S-box protein [Nitrospiraceae bacterium]